VLVSVDALPLCSGWLLVIERLGALASDFHSVELTIEVLREHREIIAWTMILLF